MKNNACFTEQLPSYLTFQTIKHLSFTFSTFTILIQSNVKNYTKLATFRLFYTDPLQLQKNHQFPARLLTATYKSSKTFQILLLVSLAVFFLHSNTICLLESRCNPILTDFLLRHSAWAFLQIFFALFYLFLL